VVASVTVPLIVWTAADGATTAVAMGSIEAAELVGAETATVATAVALAQLMTPSAPASAPWKVPLALLS
jgi:hypothetical protein